MINSIFTCITSSIVPPYVPSSVKLKKTSILGKEMTEVEELSPGIKDRSIFLNSSEKRIMYRATNEKVPSFSSFFEYQKPFQTYFRMGKMGMEELNISSSKVPPQIVNVIKAEVLKTNLKEVKMSEILDFKGNGDETDFETIIKNITNTDESIVFDYIEGIDFYIEHLQNTIRIFSAFKCPDQVRKLLSNPDLKEWQIRDIAIIAEKLTNKHYISDDEIDEIVKIIFNVDIYK